MSAELRPKFRLFCDGVFVGSMCLVLNESHPYFVTCHHVEVALFYHFQKKERCNGHNGETRLFNGKIQIQNVVDLAPEEYTYLNPKFLNVPNVDASIFKPDPLPSTWIPSKIGSLGAQSSRKFPIWLDNIDKNICDFRKSNPFAVATNDFTGQKGDSGGEIIDNSSINEIIGLYLGQGVVDGKLFYYYHRMDDVFAFAAPYLHKFRDQIT